MPEKEDLKAPWLVGSLAWFITNSHSLLMTVVHWQSSWALSLKKIKDYSLVGLRLQVLSLFLCFFFHSPAQFSVCGFSRSAYMYETTGDNFICLRHLLQSVLKAAKSNCFLWRRSAVSFFRTVKWDTNTLLYGFSRTILY